MKHKYRVMGNVEVTISTVIESEEKLTEDSGLECVKYGVQIVRKRK